MCKNAIQFQYGLSLLDFLKEYGSEEQCQNALFEWRWPNGFECPNCGHKHHCILSKRHLYQCNHCRRQTSLISNTIFESTKLPLMIWFLAMYLLTQNKTGISALNLHRQLGISYNAAWRMKQKLMQVMLERDRSFVLSGRVEIDDAYWGGERHGGKPGRGSENKAPFVAVPNFRKKTIKDWAERTLAHGAKAFSDGLACFRGIADAGCVHLPTVTGGGAESMNIEQFKWVNIMLGNVKNSLRGAYHKLDSKHLPRYLAEFNYRFNRRFDLGSMVERLGRIAARTAPMPERFLKMADIQW